MAVAGVMITKLLDALEKEGKRILAECEQERTYTHRTQNLYDSYGYGVYYNGKLQRKGFLSASETAIETKDWYGVEISGREQIENFLMSEYKSPKGMELVIVAAMPYAEVLENASSGQHQKYKVISMSYNKLKDLSSQVKGSSVSNIFRSQVQR